jgi:hypothetical protein
LYEVTALSRAKLKPVADIRILIAETEFHIRGLNEVGQGRLSAHKKLTPPMGLLLLARLHGQPIGCGALKFHQRRPAELKRMWIAPLRAEPV